MASSPYKAGKHFLQIPGPSNVPDRILRAMDYPTIDHRGPDFAKIGAACLAGMKTIFKAKSQRNVPWPRINILREVESNNISHQ